MLDKDDFILALTGTGSMRLACTYVGVCPRYVALLLSEDRDFRLACEQIMIEQVDMFVLESRSDERTIHPRTGRGDRPGLRDT